MKKIKLTKRGDRWIAQIKHNQIGYYLGIFVDINDAIKAREKAERKLWRKNTDLSLV